MMIWRLTKAIVGWLCFLIVSLEVASLGFASYVMRARLLSPEDRLMAGPPPLFTFGVQSGTGFFVNTAGDILTNRHVIDSCRRITVGNDLIHAATARVVAQGVGFDQDVAVVQVSVSAPAVAALVVPEFKSGPLSLLGIVGPFRLTGYPRASSDQTGSPVG